MRSPRKCSSAGSRRRKVESVEGMRTASFRVSSIRVRVLRQASSVELMSARLTIAA